jgi:extradiol dioxygenase family protein
VSASITCESNMHTVFHLSFPIDDLAKARWFYGEVLGCEQGRTEADRIDFNFFGHHIVAQLSREEAAHRPVPIGKEGYPLRHFGAIVPKAEFERLARRMKEAGVHFVIAPEIRHAGTVREQSTMLVLDPCGNGLEFKSLACPDDVFKP